MATTDDKRTETEKTARIVKYAAHQAGEVFRCTGCREIVQAPDRAPRGSLIACHHCQTGYQIA